MDRTEVGKERRRGKVQKGEKDEEWRNEDDEGAGEDGWMNRCNENDERLSGMDGDMMQMNEKEEDCDRDDRERQVKT